MINWIITFVGVVILSFINGYNYCLRKNKDQEWSADVFILTSGLSLLVILLGGLLEWG